MINTGRGKSVPFVIVAIIAILGLGTSAQAIIIHNANYNWFDPASGGTAVVNVQVNDNLAGVYSWLYTVTNNTFDPIPGVTNGLSGFNIVFVAQVPELANQFGPAGWTLNCCTSGPPFTAEADITSLQGPGILPGQVGQFGFDTAPRAIVLSGTPWIHSWQTFAGGFSSQVNIASFGLSQSFLATPGAVVPEPATMTLLGLGLAGFALRRRKMKA